MSGRFNWNSYPGMVHMDVTPSSLSVNFLYIQDWIHNSSWVRGISCSLVDTALNLTRLLEGPREGSAVNQGWEVRRSLCQLIWKRTFTVPGNLQVR